MPPHEPPPRFVLIAALSGRALAAAAVRSGYAPLVADCFADLDTCALAAATARVPDDSEQGWTAALARLADGRAPVGLVYGSGFEHRPALLAALARRYRLLGNAPDTVARVSDPWRFGEACAACDVPHPAVTEDGTGPDWVDKQAGGAGGAHIRAAPDGAAEPGRYRQRRVAGNPVSALFLADGRGACVLGFSDQWPDPAPDAQFRYGGAVRPAGACGHERAMTEAVGRLTGVLGLTGLNSADFLGWPAGFVLLEMNPRPGASLDLFAHPDLFHLHLRACAGHLPERAPCWDGAQAAAIVYAPRALRVPQKFGWPEWAADRQNPGDVDPGAPVCTVLAQDQDAGRARALVRERGADILHRLEGGWSG